MSSHWLFSSQLFKQTLGANFQSTSFQSRRLVQGNWQCAVFVRHHCVEAMTRDSRRRASLRQIETGPKTQSRQAAPTAPDSGETGEHRRRFLRALAPDSAASPRNVHNPNILDARVLLTILNFTIGILQTDNSIYKIEFTKL